MSGAIDLFLGISVLLILVSLGNVWYTLDKVQRQLGVFRNDIESLREGYIKTQQAVDALKRGVPNWAIRDEGN